MKESTEFIAKHEATKVGSFCSRDLNSPRAFRKVFSKATLGVMGAACGLSSNWLLVRQQGDISGIFIINRLVPTSPGSVCSCSAFSYHPPPGWVGGSKPQQNNSKIHVRIPGGTRTLIAELVDCFSFDSALSHFPN